MSEREADVEKIRAAMNLRAEAEQRFFTQAPPTYRTTHAQKAFRAAWVEAVLAGWNARGEAVHEGIGS